MPVLPNDEIEAKLRDQGLAVHIAYRQLRALESIAENLVRLSQLKEANPDDVAQLHEPYEVLTDREFSPHRYMPDANPQKS